MKKTMIRTLVLGLAIALATPAMAADPPPPIDDQFDLYWGKNRSQPSMHYALFPEDGRHEFVLGVGSVPNDNFWNYVPIGLKYNYYFMEDLALELGASYIIKLETELESFLRNEIIPGQERVGPQFMEWQAGVGLLWTPLHGKLAAFDAKLGHWDFGLAFALHGIGTGFEMPDASTSRHVDIGATLGATVRFYVYDFIAIRVDYRHYIFASSQANEKGTVNANGTPGPTSYTFTGSDIVFPAEISLGISLFIPDN